MLHTTKLNPMAHLICVAHTRLELADILVSFRKAGVENLMALGGDPPEDPAAGPGELAFAAELVELARAIGGFSIGVAAHPAGHPRSIDMPSDRDFLAAKLALADFGVTQFFFETEEYEGLVSDLRERGVDTPVLPGILPVTSLSTMGRLGGMGAAAPAWMEERLHAADRAGRRRGGAQGRGGAGHRALLPPPRFRRAGPALLHLQHLERDPRDLCRAGTRPHHGPVARPRTSSPTLDSVDLRNQLAAQPGRQHCVRSWPLQSRNCAGGLAKDIRWRFGEKTSTVVKPTLHEVPL